jgi:hypothetical protein
MAEVAVPRQMFRAARGRDEAAKRGYQEATP